MQKKINLFTIDQIEAALCEPLPGLAAQKRMAPVPRVMFPPSPDHRPHKGGVLLLIYPGGETEGFCLVLTRRTDNVQAHKGQISLPGGGVEPEDPSVAHTAIREACEEIGVCGDDVRILGGLTPLYIAPSDFCIHPYVGYSPCRPTFVPAPDEVAEVVEVPLHHLLDRKNVEIEDWIVDGEPVRVPYFNVYGHKVWGATAIVLSEFTAILEGIIRCQAFHE
jgi:8-oxo-dGTP pyrophosphatase MutT (NUDIX family)